MKFSASVVLAICSLFTLNAYAGGSLRCWDRNTRQAHSATFKGGHLTVDGIRFRTKCGYNSIGRNCEYINDRTGNVFLLYPANTPGFDFSFEIDAYENYTRRESLSPQIGTWDCARIH